MMENRVFGEWTKKAEARTRWWRLKVFDLVTHSRMVGR